MPRVVFDTVVFVRALINPFGRWGRLVFEHSGRYPLVISQPLVVELLDVLRRPEVSRKFRLFPDLDISRLLTLIGQAELVDLAEVPLVSRDPKDDKFLATAVAGGARYVVSEDTDLLVLEEYQGIRILTGEAFLQVLEGERSAGG
jgi:uncharacterized protein